MAKFKEIASAVVKMGREEAEKIYGKEAVKGAQDSLRREARRVIAKRERGAGSKEDENVIRTPTRTTTAREPAEYGIDRTPTDIEAEAKKIRSKPEWLIEEVPEGVSTARKDARRMNKKKARALVERETGETQAEFEARMEKEARQGGVKSARGRGAEPLEPQYDLTPDQANDALRGRLNVGGDEAAEAAEPDLVDLIKKYSVGRKAGGMVTSSKKMKSVPSTSKPRGVGIALRGWGKAMKKGR